LENCRFILVPRFRYTKRKSMARNTLAPLRRWSVAELRSHAGAWERGLSSLPEKSLGFRKIFRDRLADTLRMC
jgi:hypothetical protein